MNQTLTATPQIEQPVKPRSVPAFVYWLAVAIFITPLVVWFAFDHSWPSWDAAEHMRIASQYVPLLKHPKPFDPAWFLKLVSVNYFYPPTVYVAHGVLKAIFGNGAWVNDLREILFHAVLCFSIYYSASSLFKNRLTGVLSVLLINAYPIVGYMSHCLMLDFPLLCMVSAALAAMIHWNQSRTLKSTILLAIVLGACMLTKQIAVLFLFAPGVWLLWSSWSQRKYRDTVYVTLAGVIGSLMFLTWFLVNREHIMSLAHEMQHDIGYSGAGFFFKSVFQYFKLLPVAISPPLLVLFLASVIKSGKENFTNATLLWLSAGVGMLLVSAIPYEPPDVRYLLPALVFPAVISANQLARLFESRRRSLRSVAWLSAICAVLILLVENFTPYPIPLNLDKRWITANAAWSGGSSNFSPVPAGDPWGQEWVVTTIAAKQKADHCWLNILPSNPQLSVHTFEAVVSDIGAPVDVSSFRAWSASGDSFAYTTEQFNYYDWYLLKSGKQGFKLRDDASRKKYAETVNYIRTNLTLVGTKPLPDGSEVSLYRR
jgi:4-amino-4-deoxy-L-arabinose transferase-like glycosyltransferase